MPEISSRHSLRDSAIYMLKTARRLCYPANMLPKPNAEQVKKRQERFLQNSPLTREKAEEMQILSQIYTKEEIRETIDTAFSALTGQEKFSFIVTSMLMKNLYCCPATIGRLSIRSAGRLRADKCLYRGIAAPLNPGFHGMNTKYRLADREVTIREIFDTALSPEFQNNPQDVRRADVNLALNKLFFPTYTDEFPVSVTASAFVASGYASNRVAPPSMNTGADFNSYLHETASLPVIFEIKGDRENPARILPAVGPAFLLGAEDEIYLSPLSKINLLSARKNHHDKYVLTVSAEALPET